MKPRPYRAKTLSGAQQQVRLLNRTILRVTETLERFDHERRLLAQLASSKPQPRRKWSNHGA